MDTSNILAELTLSLLLSSSVSVRVGDATLTRVRPRSGLAIGVLQADLLGVRGELINAEVMV